MLVLNIVKNATGGILAVSPSSHASRPLVHLRFSCLPLVAHRRFLLELRKPDFGQKE
jgi:hypothetical protein